jgi:hypothetical protein
MPTGPVILPPVVVTDLPRTFLLDRHTDHSGRSGAGVVAIGVSFPDGVTVARWRGHYSGINQLMIFDHPGDLLAVHGHAGSTEMVWLSRPMLRRI